MPFMYRGRKISGKTRGFDYIDRVIVESVLPQLRSDSTGAAQGYIAILPNGNPALFPSDAGLTDEKKHEKYFALACRREGLTLPEIGLWLDRCEDLQYVDGCDGKKRRILTEMETSPRFDPRKYAYFWSGTYRRYVRIAEVSNT